MAAAAAKEKSCKRSQSIGTEKLEAEVGAFPTIS